MSKHYNLIIVPAEGGPARRFSVNALWLRIGLAGGCIVLIGLAVITLSWTSLAKRAADYDRLATEKSQLEADTKRIIRIAREIDLSKEALARIVRSLGGQIDVNTKVAPIDTNFDGEFMEDEVETSPGQPDETAAPWDERYSSVERLMVQDLPTEMPVQGFVSRGFHEDYLFPELSHRGIDIAGQTGVPIRAAAEGRVVFSGWTSYFGNCMLLAHTQGYLTFYGHNLYNLKKAREEVKRGEPIAILGSTGQSSAPHLHFEIWKDGIPVDPLEFTGGSETSGDNL
ncbi:MAG: M23 family metallopeptidase [Calditrichota bacterium]